MKSPPCTARGTARPPRATGPARRGAGFTLVEILIVVVILGILAAIIVPHFTDATQSSREATLREDVRHMRALVAVFRLQHRDVPPGYPGGDRTAAPTEAAFIEHMTLYSDEFCTTNANKTMVFRYGPYLSELPVNPLNKKSGVHVATGPTMPDPDENQTYAWIYNPDLQQIIGNNEGADANGRPYKDY